MLDQLFTLEEEELQNPPLPSFLLHSKHHYTCERARGIIVISSLPDTEWKDNPAVSRLKQAMKDLEDIVQKLHDSPYSWLLHPFSVYLTYLARITYLADCLKKFISSHDGHRAAFRWSDPHLGGKKHAATPAQWNLRAEIAAQSEWWYERRPPLERDYVFITFPSDTPQVIVKRKRAQRDGNSFEDGDEDDVYDSWTPKVQEDTQLIYRRPGYPVIDEPPGYLSYSRSPSPPPPPSYSQQTSSSLRHRVHTCCPTCNCHSQT